LADKKCGTKNDLKTHSFTFISLSFATEPPAVSSTPFCSVIFCPAFFVRQIRRSARKRHHIGEHRALLRRSEFDSGAILRMMPSHSARVCAETATALWQSVQSVVETVRPSTLTGAHISDCRAIGFREMLPLTMIPGFKEWTLICDALGTGSQSIIIRKGGIAEGRAGFRFQHDDFLLFPTLFHEQVAKLKLPPETPLPAQRDDGQHSVEYRARVEWTRDVSDWARVQSLAPFHLWQESELLKRFHYEEEKGKNGLSIAFVRIEKLAVPFVFPDSPKYGGCRSWIQLPEFPEGTTTSQVLTDEEHKSREAAILALLPPA
jgi:hypothetical protein